MDIAKALMFSGAAGAVDIILWSLTANGIDKTIEDLRKATHGKPTTITKSPEFMQATFKQLLDIVETVNPSDEPQA